MTSGGIIDYGVIPASSLSTTDSTLLPEKSLPFSISCESAVKLALKVSDNRAGTVVTGLVVKVPGNGDSYNDTYALGLGTVAGKKVGAYVIKFVQKSFKGDGVDMATIASTDGKTWRTPSAGSGSLSEMTSWAPAGASAPKAYKTVTGTLAVGVLIDKAGNLPLTQEVPLDGSATLEMIYL